MTHHDVDVGRAVRPVAIDAKHVAVIDRAGPSAVKISMGKRDCSRWQWGIWPKPRGLSRWRTDNNQ
jgi:hypothetical protein